MKKKYKTIMIIADLVLTGVLAAIYSSYSIKSPESVTWLAPTVFIFFITVAGLINRVILKINNREFPGKN